MSNLRSDAPTRYPANIGDRYREAKQQYPEILVLFRVGHYFEAFEEDAQVIADILTLTITERTTQSSTLKMVSFPVKSCAPYIVQLLRHHRVQLTPVITEVIP